MINEQKFKKLFGFYNEVLQKMILSNICDKTKKEILGLSKLETKEIREYLEVGIEYRPSSYVDANQEITVANISGKAMTSIISQKHLLEIEEAKEKLTAMMDINDLKQLKIVSSHTTGELMNMYGLSAYPLISLCKERGIYPLPDLSPNGNIRPFYKCSEKYFSVRNKNALLHQYYSDFPKYHWFSNIACLIVAEDDDIIKIRGIGQTARDELDRLKEMVKCKYPEHYERLIQLSKIDKHSDCYYYEPGSVQEFEEFKKECMLRQLIKFDEKASLMKVENCTESELRQAYGNLYDILEALCKRLEIYPLPEIDTEGNVVPSYLLGSSYRTIEDVYDPLFDSDYERLGVKYAHELFALTSEELNELIEKIRCEYGEKTKYLMENFIKAIIERYPAHIEKLKEIRKTQEKQYSYTIKK